MTDWMPPMAPMAAVASVVPAIVADDLRFVFQALDGMVHGVGALVEGFGHVAGAVDRVWSQPWPSQ
ncbi:hypothetical protein [Streptomyces sp. ITFR-6]|uniref:hypothetical protein n=1 Tax=Streptomyces sp. ITFR-6 TaxID=3075197 RepID=UPI002889C5D3|nr:hypothetical protein [Streptomyces sp. ITFR-6]WNI30415.1 hypothetical protein RLT59_17650 [Streptomyces sp. ITFR-6]